MCRESYDSIALQLEHVVSRNGGKYVATRQSIVGMLKANLPEACASSADHFQVVMRRPDLGLGVSNYDCDDNCVLILFDKTQYPDADSAIADVKRVEFPDEVVYEPWSTHRKPNIVPSSSE